MVLIDQLCKIYMPFCLPFALFTRRFKRNKVVDKCFPLKSNANILN